MEEELVISSQDSGSSPAEAPRRKGRPRKPRKTKPQKRLRPAALSKEDQELLRNAAIIRAMPDNIGEALANARTRPIWCSKVRWRMEMARRRSRFLF